MAIASFVPTLDRQGIPADAYMELYERFIETRAKAINGGRELPKFGCECLIAEWIGENGLNKQRRTENAQRLALPEHRVKVCPKCYDTGKIITGEDRGNPCLHLAA